MAGARRCEMINSGVKREMAMLCPNLKRLGFCPNSGDGSNVVQLNSCGFRHYVTLSDEPVCGIPTSGDVFVRVGLLLFTSSILKLFFYFNLGDQLFRSE